MIKSVELSYKEHNLTISQTFEPEINVIEKPNGWGKTTILNTILAAYMMKYPEGKSPTGTAKIETSDGTYLYSKWVWVGTGRQQDINMKYIMPWKFFDETPKKQREIIVNILGVDYESFMRSHILEWHTDYAKQIKKEMNENKGKEDILLENIQRLKSQIIIYENKPIVIEDNSKVIQDAYKEWHTAQNETYNKIKDHNNSVTTKHYQATIKLHNLETEYKNNENKMVELREQFLELNKDIPCPSCKQALPKDNRSIMQQDIQVKGKALSERNEQLKIDIGVAKAELDALVQMELPREVPFVYDINLQAQTVQIPLKKTSEQEMELVRQYEYNKKELALYETQLKELNKINHQEILNHIAEVNKQFTELLQNKIKDNGLEGVSLFRIKADGEPTETFEIKLNDTTYNELSTGLKQILHVRMALFFSKIIGLDFIMMDEMGTISNNTWEQIKKEVEGMQFIGFRAKPFKITKRKTTKKSAKPSDGIEDEQM